MKNLRKFAVGATPIPAVALVRTLQFRIVAINEASKAVCTTKGKGDGDFTSASGAFSSIFVNGKDSTKDPKRRRLSLIHI